MTEEKRDVRSVYRQHKHSCKKRPFTRSLLTTLSRPTVNRLEEGEVYCMKYVSHDSLTDKWHVLSTVYITEVNGQYVKGINLLYLNPSITLKILGEAEKFNKENLKQSPFFAQLLKEFESQPLKCAIKQFSVHRIVSSFRVKREDWGMLPLLEKGLFGNLNAVALQEDWKREDAEVPEKKKKKKKLKPKKVYNEEVMELEEEFNPEEVFESTGASAPSKSLDSLRDEILGEDDI